MNEEKRAIFMAIFQSEYHSLATLWLKRDRKIPYSKKWLRFDKRLNRNIEKASRRFEKAGCYLADWYVRAYFYFLKNQQ